MPLFKHGRIALVIGVLLMSGSLSARADDCDDCQPGAWERFKCWRDGDDCDKCKKKKCRKCHGCKGCDACKKCCSCYIPLGYHCDPRDTRLYSDPGYNVPVAVPLAPVVKHTYNYGWGVPSSRLVRVGARYNQWYPDAPYTQTEGRLPGGMYPVIYQPTDTTQLGAYHVHVPRWGRYAYGAW
ncbi:MAG: hypothetical protein ACT4QC_20490 [Planctomycetaceae bacterium]